jgi:hypothetical protein
MALLSLWLALFCTSVSHAESPAATVQPLNLEFGAGIGWARGEGGLPESTERALFTAIFGYHFPDWFLGITTRGAFSTAGPTKIEASQVMELGSLSHRSIEYGLVARRYVTQYWYAQVAGGLAYNEATTSDSSLKPNPTSYADRFYLDGTWIQASIGREFPDSPWFARVEYTYTWYYRTHVIGTDEGVNKVIEEHMILSHPHEHILTLVVGLANIF